jgi:hypothetical protein
MKKKYSKCNSAKIVKAVASTKNNASSVKTSEIISDIFNLDKIQHGEIALHIGQNHIINTYKKAVNLLLHLIQQKKHSFN